MSSLDAAYAKWADLDLDTASEDDEPQRPRAAPSKKRSKRRVEAVAAEFPDVAFEIRFQPFQLYPDLPRDSRGVDKLEYFTALSERRRPNASMAEKKARIAGLVGAWKADGLDLTSPFGVDGGRWGSSFDAQRLIWLARQQGREDPMIEAIYKLNHVDNEPLSDHAKLLEAARAAGVQRAPELLAGPTAPARGRCSARQRVAMGINAVPVIVLDDKHVISNGAPEKDFLRRTFKHLIDTGTVPPHLGA
ncbi:dithiol-disulfide isomerase [Aureococcus anophagefferens]|nr:dithiol-disulfide isomerase [Aureococcus anophagefferens]